MSSFSWADDVEENWDELPLAKKLAEAAAAAEEAAIAEAAVAEAAATAEAAGAKAAATEERFNWVEDVKKHEEELASEKKKLAETTDQAVAEKSVDCTDEAEEQEVTPATQVAEEHEDTEYVEEADVCYLSPVEMLGPTGFRLAETWYEPDFINNGHLPPPSCPSKTRSAPSRWSYLNVVQLASDEDEDEGKDEIEGNFPSTPPLSLSSLAGDEVEDEGEDEDEGKDELERNLPPTPPPILSSFAGDEDDDDEGKDEIDRKLPSTPPILSFLASNQDEEDEGKDELERNLPPTPPPILPSSVNDEFEFEFEGKDETDRNDHGTDPETTSEVDEAATSQSDVRLAPSVDVPAALPCTPPPPAILDPPPHPHPHPRQTPHEYFVATVSCRSSLIIQLLKRLFHQLVG